MGYLPHLEPVSYVFETGFWIPAEYSASGSKINPAPYFNRALDMMKRLFRR
jgi:hypothetical protein